MEAVKQGTFFGEHNARFSLADALLTDTVYTHKYVDWHYHERPYFTFLLQGGMIEGNKKEKYICTPGTLLFHHWQDAHYNIKSSQFTRGFHVEVGEGFTETYDLPDIPASGSRQLYDPFIKILFRKIYFETRLQGDTMELAVNQLLLNVFDRLSPGRTAIEKSRPGWLKSIKEALHESSPHTLSLKSLALEAGIHPVHLSREFPKFFHATVGEYLRMLKMEKALDLMLDSNLSMTDIAYRSGFADQSHLIRNFRYLLSVKPSVYRRFVR